MFTAAVNFTTPEKAMRIPEPIWTPYPTVSISRDAHFLLRPLVRYKVSKIGIAALQSDFFVRRFPGPIHYRFWAPTCRAYCHLKK